MNAFAGFLRAVNVGGTGKLPMAKLRALCEDIGLTHVSTYIASGNVAFVSENSADVVKAALERKLLEYAGKHVAVVIRTADELAAVIAANPFADGKPNFTLVSLLDEPAHASMIEAASGRKDESIVAHNKELYVYYTQGMGTSKLKIPAANAATSRNMNTIRKMAELTAALAKDLK
ncbi:MAG: DUF1697 domain-containing protein [Pseudomonadota bacterium]